MDQEELHTQILMRDYLERQELKASAIATNHCVDMESDELRRYVYASFWGSWKRNRSKVNCLSVLVVLTDELERLRKANAEL